MTTTNGRQSQGTAAWFEMAGTLMCEAASRSGLSPNLHVSLVERYTDGVELSKGLFQGLRFNIIGGVPSYRVGVRQDERADVTVEITAAAAHLLNTLHNADPRYQAALGNFAGTSEMRTDGDPSQMGAWLNAVHDPIVDRTSLGRKSRSALLLRLLETFRLRA